MKIKVQLAALAAVASLVSVPAHAATVFSQDFQSGLGANERVSGQFVVSQGKVGHTVLYGRSSFSYYQLALDLTGVSNAMLALDFFGNTELGYDGFNLVASLTEVFSPTGRVAPTQPGFYSALYNEAANYLGSQAFSGTWSGPLAFDLSAYDGQKVNLRFQFASDYAVGGSGIQLDNLKVTGTLASAVPEPATWALMIAGFALMGGALRVGRRGLSATGRAISA